MYAQLPAVRVNNKSLFLDLLRVVVVDTEAGFPIEPELNDDVDDAESVNPMILAFFPFGNAGCGAATSNTAAISAFDNPVMSSSNTRSVPSN